MIANVIDLRAESATRTTLAIWIDVGDAQPGLGYAHGCALRVCLRVTNGSTPTWVLAPAG